MKYYNDNEAKRFALDVTNMLNVTISEKQAQLIIDRMDGSAYLLGIENNKLFRLDINEEDGELIEYSILDTARIILEWQDDFAEERGDTKMDKFTLEDMQDEESYIRWCGGIWGSQEEMEETRKDLYSLKLDEIELEKLFKPIK